MVKKKVLFIINPISGGKKKDKLPEIIKSNLDSSLFESEVVFTQYRGHAAELSGKGGFDYYVAAGGDGTINETASALIHSEACMGILPLGSGNGLARHIGIQMNIEKAITQLNTAIPTLIDSCLLNGQPFVNMAGIGFDAHIGKTFAESAERGFKTYLKQTLTEFKAYNAQKYVLSYDGKTLTTNAFLISFANSSQYGNNAYIAPEADLQDGYIDVCILQPFGALQVPEIGLRIFTKSIGRSSYYQTIRIKDLTIERESDGVAHLDGEPIMLGNILDVKVIPASLRLLIPALKRS